MAGEAATGACAATAVGAELALGEIMRSLAILTIACIAATPSYARSLIQCRSGSDEVVISLQDRKAFGRTLSCIIKSNFVADMTPCASNGGFGLSAPTGMASLGKVVDRWQDYMDHMGGVVGFGESAATISFTGGFVYSGDYKPEWSFEIDRLSGRALLKQTGKKDIAYTCSAVKPKL